MRIVEEQAESGNTVTQLITCHVESECIIGEIHVNIVVIDANGKYRGHKHSTIRSVDRVDKQTFDDLCRVLRFGNELSKVFSATLRGQSLVICGEDIPCKSWVRILPRFFSLSTYTIKPWISLIDEFVKDWSHTPLQDYGALVLVDTGLLKPATRAFSDKSVVELRSRSVHHGEALSYTRNLVKLLRGIPSSQDQALLTLLTSQMDGLRNLMNQLTRILSSSLTETVVLRAGEISEVEFIEMLLDQVLPTVSRDDLRTRMKHDELEILAPHLIQGVPALASAVKGRHG